MAMLAGPRRKQRVVNLRAKNNAWSNDSTKFGQRMLEKMGWSEGKGLGARENGNVDHVVARFKNDDTGLGFEDRNDQWTKHEDDFNSLLANLSNGINKDEKLHSGVSLEVKSKKSKARVHYHKFTRGKDLTRYSEKDLANIFGKKSLKNESKQKLKENVGNDDVTPTEQVFTEKGSMEDYFKIKLAAIKSKAKLNVFNNDTNYDDRPDYSFKGFSGATNDKKEESNQAFDFQPFSLINMDSNDNFEKENAIIECQDNYVEPKKSKKKNKQKCKANKLIKEDNNLEYDKAENNLTNSDNAIIECQDDYVEPKKKSKKKNKQKCEADKLRKEDNNLEYDKAENDLTNSDTISEEPQKTKKSKKEKQKMVFDESVEESIDSKKSKKNRKKSLLIKSNDNEKSLDVKSVEDHLAENYVPKKKKKRKNKDINK